MMKRLTFIGLLAVLVTGSAVAQSVGLATFTAPLSPSSENPPVEGVRANGTALVLIHMSRDTSGKLTKAVVDFHIDFNSEAALTVTAMHIHRGVRGVNGPVVIDSIFGTALAVEPGSTRLFRQNVVTSDAGLATVEDLLSNPARYYVNMHSTSNPSGVVRGQLELSNGAQFSSLKTQIDALQTANTKLAAELAKNKETLARISRRLGVVPVE